MKELRNLRNGYKLSELEKERIDIIDKYTKINRWYDIEHTIMTLDTKCNLTEEDLNNISMIRHYIMVLSISKQFGEENENYLNNMKEFLYKEINDLYKNNNNLHFTLFKIVLFVEDYLI